MPPFRRVLLETTGLADPAPIMQMLLNNPMVSHFLRLDAVVTTVDAVNAWRQLDEHAEAAKQVAIADRLLLTKIDLVDAAGGPYGQNMLVYNDEYLATEIGQTGTQFDGLGHIGIQLGKDGDKSQMHFYNGFTMAEMADPYGLKKLGVEKLKPIFTRGHLVDIEAVKGRMMDAGEEITVADIRAALAKQNMQEGDIKPGDAIFYNTGWGRLWMTNNDRFNSGEPGQGSEVARWVAEKDLCLTGADTWAVEVVPNPDKGLAFICHQELQTKLGIVNHENLVFDELIADKKYQFVFIFAPTPIKGATGSNGCPIAVT